VAKWTAADMPNLTGKVAIVTGASSGLGLETAAALAAAGAETVLGCRRIERAQRAVEEILRRAPAAKVRNLPLDLSDLKSIERFAQTFTAQYDRLDILCNNAGAMMLPYGRTPDGFELVFGTNHLGPFALTGRLFECIRGTPGARVVALGSLTHRTATLDLDDLNWQRRPYSKAAAYGASKLANMLFAFELDRRLREAAVHALSVAAHPGWAATDIALGGVREPVNGAAKAWKKLVDVGNTFFAQPAALGALPTLYAATAPAVEGGAYIGPDGLFQMRGHPIEVDCENQARDPELAAQLWRKSEELTAVSYLS
jgi:NAD(P)-dependent dehydrogenase (short-subunit alcohol dehydrogenase family)